MGLHVHSLDNIPKSENRDYLIYLLEYGWHEPLAEALDKNFFQMAGVAAKNRAVVIKGTELAHFGMKFSLGIRSTINEVRIFCLPY